MPRRPRIDGDPCCIQHSKLLPPKTLRSLIAAKTAFDETPTVQRSNDYAEARRAALKAWNRRAADRRTYADTDPTIGQGTKAIPEGFVGPRKDAWS